MRKLIISLLVCLTSTLAIAADRIFVTSEFDTGTRIDVNNLEMVVTNRGSFARHIDNQGQSGLWFPSGTDKTLIYAAGIQIGGIVNDEVRVTVAEYTYEFVPGPLGSDPNDPLNRVFKIEPGDITSMDYVEWPFQYGAPYQDLNQNGRYDTGEPPLLLGDQTLFCVFNDGDPAVHLNDAGGTLPMNIEIQLTVWAFNRRTVLDNIIFMRYKIINKSDDLIEDAYINIWSDPDLGWPGDDYIGCNPEINLGFCYNASDDFVYGNRPPAQGFLQLQGPIVPVDGDQQVILPDGQIYPNSEMRNMYSFMKYIGGTDPHRPSESYAYMRGLEPGYGYPDRPIINPVTGNPTTFICDGDPVSGYGWLDTDANDRRMSQATGPFDLPPWADTDGDGEPELGEPGVQEYVQAVVVGLGTDRLSSLTLLRTFARQATYEYWHNFPSLETPSAPTLSAAGLDEEIVLYWAPGQTSPWDTLYHFEGYNVYQLASPEDPDPLKIATFDLENAVTTIIDPSIVDGEYLMQIVQEGEDRGISNHWRTDWDYVRHEPIANNRTYYYAVTAYHYNPDTDAVVRFRESDYQQAVVTVTPEQRAADYPLTQAYGDTLDYEYNGKNDGWPRITVVDPMALTGDEYAIVIDEVIDGDECGYIVDYVNGQYTQIPLIGAFWDLINTTTGDTLLSHQPVRYTDDPDNIQQPVIDGFSIRVNELKPGFKRFEVAANASGPLDPPEPGALAEQGFPVNGPITDRQQVGAGHWAFHTADNGGFRYTYQHFWERVMRDGQNTVYLQGDDFEMRFTGSNDQPGINGSYAIEYFNDDHILWVPFELWNIGHGTIDDLTDDYRMFGFIIDDAGEDLAGDDLYALESWGYEDNGHGDWEHSASPDYDDPFTDWVYWIRPVDHTPGEGGYLAAEAAMLDGTFHDHVDDYYDVEIIARTVLINVDGGLEPPFNQDCPEPGTVFRLVTNKTMQDGDVFTFRTSAPAINPDANREVLNDIRVVPNPLFHLGMDGSESVRFTHLPAECTIRIFNLAGDRVRKLDKADVLDATLDWDLRNDHGRRIADGIYVWYLESDYGSAQGKVAIFRAE